MNFSRKAVCRCACDGRHNSQERSKWERVLQASEEAGHAASQQLQDLTRQVAELRRRAEEAEEKLSARDAEMTRVRLECLEREKAAVRRTKDEFEQALQAERRASEEAIQVGSNIMCDPGYGNLSC
jgi:hypothetical protein